MFSNTSAALQTIISRQEMKEEDVNVAATSELITTMFKHIIIRQKKKRFLMH